MRGGKKNRFNDKLNDMHKTKTKNLDRIIRVMRLLAVVQTYHYYTMMQLNRQLLQIDNNWKDAEHMSHWMNVLFPFKETNPTDFLYDKDEVSDEALDNYAGFKKWMEIAGSMGISEKTLTAFCKNVDNCQSAFRLKTLGHIYYPDWLLALLLYLNKSISKTELQKVFVEFSFSGKAKPANIAGFRKTVLDIENTILQISNKQINRGIKKKYDLK